MPPNIKAIETKYKGYRFRSRLEARWAVFFDELGLEWEYEPEGFELPSGLRYLPDFRLHNLTHSKRPVYAEVKPRGEDSFKGEEFSEKSQSWLVLLDGAPEPRTYSLFPRAADGRPTEMVWGPKRLKVAPKNQILWPLATLNAVRAARSARFEFGEQGVAR